MLAASGTGGALGARRLARAFPLRLQLDVLAARLLVLLSCFRFSCSLGRAGFRENVDGCCELPSSVLEILDFAVHLADPLLQSSEALPQPNVLVAQLHG